MKAQEQQNQLRVTIDLEPSLIYEFKRMSRTVIKDDAPGIEEADDLGKIVNMELATAVGYLHDITARP